MAYSDKDKTKIINEICERVTNGEALRNICNEDGQISSTTFYEWLDDDEDKQERYTRAGKDRANHIFEDILDIADNQEKDVLEDKDGNEYINHNVINRAKIRIDARKWMLGKMDPTKYADTSKLQLEGGDPNKPIIWQETKSYNDSNPETDESP